MHLKLSAPSFSVGVAALVLALVAWTTPFLPPFPLPGWFIGGSVIGPFEHWWYSLPDGSRSIALYNVGTSIGAVVYPAVVLFAFWFWCTPLRRGESAFPRRTLALALGAILLSTVYFVLSWSNGLEYQGLNILVTYIAISVATLGALWVGWSVARRHSSWWGSLAAHWGLFFWICVFAFPWIGEMI